jgi:ATP-dependent exoDNAse (exonuclease V) beta subunit
MHINSSRLSTFNTCKRRFYWEYVHGGHGLRPTYTNDKLSWGILAHEGLAALYKGQTLGQALAHVRDYAMEVELPWDNFTADEKNFWLDQIEWINQTLKVYDPWRQEHDKFQVLEVEAEGECVVGEVCYECGAPYAIDAIEGTCEAPWEGSAGRSTCGAPLHYFVYRVDLAVNHMGAMKIIDHKTTGSASENYMHSWDHSFQLALYTYGYKKSLQGDDPDPPEIGGYGMNIIKKLRTIGEEAPLTKKCPECKQGKRS